MKKLISLCCAIVTGAITFSSITPVQAAEDSVYDFSWLDKDKEVYVLQNRKFRKVMSPYVTLGGGVTVNGKFVDSYYAQGRVGMFFKEELGLEFLYTKANGKENDTMKSVNNIAGGAGVTAARRIVDNYWGAAFLWSPFYAKINTFNKIVYMDWIIGAGVGQLEETNNNKRVLSQLASTPEESESHFGGLLEMTLKFWVNQHWTVNFDVVGFYYKADMPMGNDEAKSEFEQNYDIGLSLTYNF